MNWFVTYPERLLKMTYVIVPLSACLCCYFLLHSAENDTSPQNCLLVRAVGTLARSLVNLARALITGIRWHSHIYKVQYLTTSGKMASVSQHKDWFGMLTLLHLSLTPCDTLFHKLAHYLTAFSINCIKGRNSKELKLKDKFWCLFLSWHIVGWIQNLESHKKYLNIF